MLNPKLKVGERVCLHFMPDKHPIPTNTYGTVKKVSTVFGDDIYSVNWDNGRTLNLISGEDVWGFEPLKKQGEKKKIKEQTSNQNFDVLFGKNGDVFKLFNMRFLYKYLILIKKSGIVNMFGAAPYLYMGKERLEHEFKYKDIHNEEAFEQVLDLANQAQAEMINGVINVLESKGVEDTLENLNKYIRVYSSKVLQNYIHLH
jgi:hypothetical protein